MFKKLFTISLALLVLSSITFGQAKRYIINAKGEMTELDKSLDLKEAIKASGYKSILGEKEHYFSSRPDRGELDIQAAGLADTMNYADLGIFNTNFGFFGYDQMFTYFVAPADLTIKAASFSVSDSSSFDISTASIRLLKLNWTYDELKAYDEATHMGVYPSDGDGANNVDPFGEEATGPWQPIEGAPDLPPWTDNADPAQNTWEYDLWSDEGLGWPITADEQPTNSDGAGDYLFWAEMINLGFEPEVKKGEVFAVSVSNDNTFDVWDPDYDGAANRIGFFSDNSIGIPTWKYYEMGRGSDGNAPGWWVRLYTWDFAVAVDITGDIPPSISDMTNLGTTLSTEDRTVSATIVDTNPGGGPAGIASADLVYTLDGGDEVRVAMSAAGDVYSGVIPGQQPGTEVTYWIEATDVEGLEATSAISVTYNIFAVENPNALLVFNGLSAPTGYPQSYYFGKGDFVTYTVQDWDHDVWSFGGLTEELVSGYNNIIEITAEGPTFDNSAVIAAWLAADGTRNYMLTGDEWLGAVAYGWPGSHNPVDVPAGDFAHDILGVTTYYGDLVEASTNANDVHPQEGSALGGDLLNLYNQTTADEGWTAPMTYDPEYETGFANWLDGVDFAEDVEVDITGISTDTTNGTADTEYSIGGHRILAAGNKIVFLSYDPISLNSDGHGAGHGAEYRWYGFDAEAPQVKALEWFGALVVGVEDELTPFAYELAQNYPNPFNPSTKIAFSVPTQGNVTLKVYNMLGQEVATLLNEVKNAGVHEVAFDGINLSSGVYFYTITAGDFVSTKKMMLLK